MIRGKFESLQLLFKHSFCCENSLSLNDLHVTEYFNTDLKVKVLEYHREVSMAGGLGATGRGSQ